MLHSRLSYLIFAATIALISANYAAAQGYLFNQYGAPPTNALTASTYAFAQGDFNQDGRFDFAVSETLAGGYTGVGIYLAQPDGTYQLNDLIDLDAVVGADPPYTIAVADINGDGLLDIVCVGAVTGNIYALLGEGNGFFQSPVITATGIQEVTYLAVGDFNGDGLADIALDDVGNGFSGVYILLSNGDGTFGSPNSYGLGGQGIIAADFRGNGKLDLATTNPDGQSVSVSLGNGDGTFQNPVSITFSTDVYPYALAAADITGDNKLDLAVGLAYGSLAVLPGNGDGTFQSPIFTNGIPESGITNLVTGDFNGDGKVDVAGQAGNGAWVLLGNGNGTFQTAPQEYGPTTTGWAGLLSGDYNLDGKLDLAILPYIGTLFPPISILTNNGNGTFLSSTPLQGGKKAGETFAVASADLNGDGNLDVVAVNKSTNNLSVFLGKGKGEFLAPKTYDTGNSPEAVAVGDFNGDGYPDLAVTNYNDGTVSILLNEGNGTFQKQVTYAVGSRPLAIAVADINHDGNLDLVVASSSGASALVVLLGNGNGTFQPMTPYGTDIGAGSALALADFNADGNLDVAVVTNDYYPLWVLFGDGSGGFSVPQSVSAYPIQNVYSVTAGDLRAVGLQDIVVGGGCCGVESIGVLLNNGSGTFQSPVGVGYAGIQVDSILLADVNGDGNLDIVAASNPAYTQEVAVLLGDGGGGFGQALQYYAFPAAGPNSVAVGDFNGDGSLDLAVTNPNGTNGVSVSLFLSNPVPVFSSSSLNFGTVKAKSSSTLTLTVTNQSPTKLTVDKIAIKGSGYSQTNTCGTVVAGYANCAVTVTFKPTAKKEYAATLTFTDSAAGAARTISLSGTGD